jgi:hypothetical protein
MNFLKRAVTVIFFTYQIETSPLEIDEFGVSTWAGLETHLRRRVVAQDLTKI